MTRARTYGGLLRPGRALDGSDRGVCALGLGPYRIRPLYVPRIVVETLYVRRKTKVKNHLRATQVVALALLGYS